MPQVSNYYKIQVVVPVKDADNIRQIINEAGGSRQGNYDYASGSVKTVGRFRPLSGAKPHIGKKGIIEEVEEEIIMTLCHKDKLKEVIQAISQAHPYEEPAIDILQRYEI